MSEREAPNTDDDKFAFTPKPHTLLRLRLAAAGYLPIPIAGKRPNMPRWQTRTSTTDGDILVWQTSGYFRYQTNTGLLARNTPAIDVDISAEDAAIAIEDLARERLGNRGRFLTRIGRAPRRAILLRTGEPFKKLTREFNAPDGSKQAIEILCDGQQLASFGVHPDTGSEYEWRGGVPGDVAAKELPCVSQDDMIAFLDEAEKVLVEKFYFKRVSSHNGSTHNGKAHNGTGDEHSSEPRASIKRVRAALKVVPNDDAHWDDWTRIGMATWAATDGSADGFAAWDAWSQKSAKYQTAETAKKWTGFHRSPPHRIGAGTLFHMASEIDPDWNQGFFGAEEDASPEGDERSGARPNGSAFPAQSLEDVHSVFERWLGAEYDMATLDAVLAVTAAERLGGDPAWLLVISGPGNAKTETVQSIGAISNTHIISTIASEGALLSATPKKGRGSNATGGLLRKIGDRGLLVIKDVTSILSMDRNVRSTVLAALREIHDGRWERNVGTDGGRTLSWEGRIVVIGACTTAWDQAHGVIASMGDRFVTIRSNSNAGRLAAGTRAIRNAGVEAAMRKEMAEAVAGLIDHADYGQDYALSDDEIDDILHAANIVTLARTGVETDYRGDIIDAHAPEMPTRFAKQLSAVMRGGVAIGMPRNHALALAMRCAKDSVPQLRLDVLKDLEANGESRVADIRRRLQKPWRTVDRTLQALHALGLLRCREEEKIRNAREVQVRHYQLAPPIVMDLQHLLHPNFWGV